MKEQILTKKYGEEKVNKLWGLDPTPNKKYINWILTLDNKVSIREEDYYKFPETLNLFHENKHRMEVSKRDILNYGSLSEVHSIAKEFEKETSKREEESSVKERAYKESILHYKDDELVIVEPKTEFASCFFGKGTQWCTAATKSNNAFNSYKNRGKSLFIFMFSDGRKFQGCTSRELRDGNDRLAKFKNFLTLEQINYVPISKVLVKVDPLLLEVIKNQTPEICLEAVQKDWEALQYVITQTPEICLEAVKQDGWALPHVKNRTPEICLEAVKQNGWALQWVKNQTSEICLEAVKQSPHALQFVKNQAHEICLEAVRQNGRALQWVNNQTSEICLEAVKQDGEALEHVKNQTYEICLAAVKQEGFALKHVETQTPELCLEAVKQNGCALYYVKNQTEEICLTAVTQNGRALESVENQTEEICLTAVKQDCWALQWVGKNDGLWELLGFRLS